MLIRIYFYAMFHVLAVRSKFARATSPISYFAKCLFLTLYLTLSSVSGTHAIYDILCRTQTIILLAIHTLVGYTQVSYLHATTVVNLIIAGR